MRTLVRNGFITHRILKETKMRMKSIKKLEKNTVLKFFPSKLTPNLQEIQETDTWVNILIKIFGNLKKYIIFTNFK